MGLLCGHMLLHRQNHAEIGHYWSLPMQVPKWQNLLPAGAEPLISEPFDAMDPLQGVAALLCSAQLSSALHHPPWNRVELDSRGIADRLNMDMSYYFFSIMSTWHCTTSPLTSLRRCRGCNFERATGGRVPDRCANRSQTSHHC